MRKFFLVSICTWILAGLIPVHGQDPVFTIEQKVVDCATPSVTVGVSVQNFTDITSFQFAIVWDNSVLQYSGHQSFLPPAPLFNTLQAANGEFRASWFDFNAPPGETLPNDSTIFQITFSILGNAGDMSDIQFASLPTFPTEVSNTSGIIPLNNLTFNDGLVEIEDLIDPVFSGCPSDISVFAGIGNDSTVVSWTPPVASDNCGLDTAFSNFLPGQNFPIGNTAIQYVAIDNEGNQGFCDFNVEVLAGAPGQSNPVFKLDREVIACTTQQVVIDCRVFEFDTIQGFQFALTWDPTVIDYVSHLTFLQPTTLINTDDVGTGVLRITWNDFDSPPSTTLPDSSVILRFTFDVLGTGGDSTMVAFDSLAGFPVEVSRIGGILDSSQYMLMDGGVVISDTEAPEIMDCPNDIFVMIPAGDTEAVVNWIPPTATDNCILQSFVASHMPNDTFGLGTTTVTYTATDSAGNQSICSFDVEVMADNLGGLVTLRASEFQLACDQPTTIVDISVFNFDSINSMQFGIMWDTAVLRLNRYDNFLPPAPIYEEDSVDAGMLGLSWLAFTNPPFLSLTNNSVIIRLRFDVVGNPGDSSLVKFISLPGLPIEISRSGMLLGPGQRNLVDGLVRLGDNEAPVFNNCPVDMVIPSLSDTCGAFVTWDPVTITDNCDADATITRFTSLGSGDFFPDGPPTLVGFEAVDNQGNRDTCRFTVQISDQTPPVITFCPSDIVVYVQADTCGQVVSWDPVMATDNCDPDVSISQTAGPANGSFFPAGNYTINIQAADDSMNVSNCSFQVSVRDSIRPELLACPSDIDLFVLPDTCGNTVSWDPVTATDNCDPDVSINLLNGLPSGSFFQSGSTLVRYEAVDDSGNRILCSFTVTIQDTVAPVISGCPTDTLFETEAGICSAIVNWIPPTAADNCSSVILTSNIGPGARLNEGTHRVRYFAVDGSGKVDSCSFVITVADRENPGFSACPPDLTLTTNMGDCFATGSWTPPTPTDNCAVDTSWSTHMPGDAFNRGITVVTYYARDLSGNLDSCSFLVDVLDDEPPVFTFCPDTVRIGTDPGDCTGTATWSVPIAEDPCGINDISSSADPGVVLGIGFHDITYIATDAAGNADTCTFVVEIFDDEPPAIDCPANVIFNAGVGVDSAVVNNIMPFPSDNCALDSVYFRLSGATTGSGPNDASGTLFYEGPTEVTYFAVDASGNIDSCSFIVRIVSDNLQIDCPVDQIVSNDPGLCGAEIFNLPVVILTDPDSVAHITYQITGATMGASPPTGFNDVSGTFFNVGLSVVNYKIYATNGDSLTCSFSVRVNDTEQPEIQNCPVSFIVAGNCPVPAFWNQPTATDNCGVATFTSNRNSGDPFPLGVHTVRYTATDTAGNTRNCTFDITVVDQTPPQLAGCPTDFIVSTDPDSCTAVVTWTPPTATDNCSAITISSTRNPGSRLSVGRYPVRYFAEDISGNRDSCSFTVTVQDQEAPIFSGCPADQLLNTDTLLCTAIASWTAPAATDNCGMDTIWSTHQPGDTFPSGLTEVTYYARDMGGNLDSCTFLIEVVDNEKPVSTVCPADLNFFAGPGSCDALVSWDPPEFTDNCAIDTITNNFSPGDLLPAGRVNVIYVASDPSGNSITCQFQVTVRDTTPPLFDCPEPVVVLVDGTVISDPDGFLDGAVTDNCTGVILDFDVPSATDACMPIARGWIDTLPYNPGSSFPPDTFELVARALDIGGNMDECRVQLTVLDLDLVSLGATPSTLCEAGTFSLNASANVPGATYRWVGPNGFTADQPDTLIADAPVDASGRYYLSVTSPGGCTLTDSLDVTVNERPKPEIEFNDILCTDGSSDLDLSVNDTSNTTLVSWSWTGPAGFTSDLPAPVIPNISPQQSGLYTVIVENQFGCTAVDTATIMVDFQPPPPSLQAAGGDDSLCVLESIILTGTAYSGRTVTYNWEVNPVNGVVWTPADTNQLSFMFNRAGDFTISYSALVNGCSSDTSEIVIHVDSVPSVAIATNAPLLCTDGQDTLFLSETFGLADSWSWTGPGFTSNQQNVFIPNAGSIHSGLYTVTATRGDGCSSTASVNVVITDGPQPRRPDVQISDTEICIGADVTLTGQTYVNMNGVVYRWVADPAAGSGLPGVSNNSQINVTPTAPGTYTYSYSATVGGCPTDTVDTQVVVHPTPEVMAGSNSPLLCVDDDSILQLSETGDDAVEWSWTGPDNFFSNQQSPAIQPVDNQNEGDYIVNITDQFGCVNRDTVSVSITLGVPPISLSTNMMTWCELEDSIVLVATDIPGATYTWFGPVNITDNTSSIVFPEATDDLNGVYNVVATNADGCQSPVSNDVTVMVLKSPEALPDAVDVIFETAVRFSVLGNDTLESGQGYTITVISDPSKGVLEDLGNGEYSYTPNPGELDEDYFTYEICYDACDMLCARAVVTLLINYDPDDCVIPNLVTPNNDGKNDRFRISCVEIGKFPENELIIFNEWGDEVYRAAPYNNDWEGTYNGSPLPDGTYYYIFKRDANAKPDKGFITLFR